jgi:hypothetical protein
LLKLQFLVESDGISSDGISCQFIQPIYPPVVKCSNGKSPSYTIFINFPSYKPPFRSI